MTIAGGIMGALFHRERTGEATEVDVSLLGTGMWAMGQAFALSLQMGVPWVPPPIEMTRANPLVATYQTADGPWLSLCCLQAGHYWPQLCTVLGRPDLATDPRFADHASVMANNLEAGEVLRSEFHARPLAEWREILAPFTGQWAVVQDTLQAADDPQSVANGYVQDCQTAAGTPFRLITAPVRFGGSPAAPNRAPEFNEHGDEILGEVGLDWDVVIDLKVRGVVA
jgi:crotonobetainyl-CoA:carnitine CoA-transferase CaiB-like acyl-CoA transferase